MSIERELRNHLQRKLKDLDTKQRDIELILYFYGFEDEPWPTLENAAIRFNVGNSNGRRSERPRQIIKSKFKETSCLNDFPALKEFSKYLKSSNLHFSTELDKFALEKGLYGGKENVISVLRLLNDLDDSKDYKAYTYDLKELTKSSYKANQTLVVCNKSSLKNLKKSFKLANTTPGLVGIAKLEYLIDEVDSTKTNIEHLIKLIKSNSDSWFCTYEEEEYYLFESRDNVLINNIEKIKNVTDFEDINTLTTTLRNSLNKRSLKKGKAYPPEGVIHQYLSSSKYTEYNPPIIELRIVPKELTVIETDAVKYMTENDVHDTSTISAHLLSSGHSKPNVDSTVFRSPLIHIDKSSGVQHYKIKLIGSNVSKSPTPISNYEEFRQRLIKASAQGTNGSSEVTTRKEHHILWDWLFKGKKYDKCAICQKEYSIKSLVAAHKKKRCDCAENERTDPYIVMPLCTFGCDYLYERGLIYVQSGEVKLTQHLDVEYRSELSVINDLVGMHLDSQWLTGSKSYFRQPGKIAQNSEI